MSVPLKNKEGDYDEDEDDDESGIPKIKTGKNRAKKLSNLARQINKLTYRQAEGKNKKRMLAGSHIEKTLEIDMPSISAKIV